MRQPIYKQRPIEPNPAEYGGERINDFIILSEAFSNCYLIETSEGNVQINAGMGMEAPVIEKNFQQFSHQPITALILTQGHVDHVGGVGYFRKQNPDMQVIASANNIEHQEYDARLAPFRANRSAFAFTDKFMQAFSYYAEQGYTDYPPQDKPTPDVLLQEKMVLEQGGVTIEIIPIAGAETNDSVIVWLPQHKICFTGNLFGCAFGHFPNLVTIRGDRYRDPLVVAKAVAVVRDLQPEIICYGHHGPVIGKEIIQEELTALYESIHYVHDETVKGMNEGKSVHELMEQIKLPAEIEVGDGYGKVAWGVRAIWESYAGWFHHQSTTELYAVPQSAVNGDLIELAGGVENILKKAAEKIANKKYPEAIHLLDIVRSEEENNSEYKRLYIQAHENLLAESENFWLSSWLSNQIKTTQLK